MTTPPSALSPLRAGHERAPRRSTLLTPGTALVHRDAGWVLHTADGEHHTVLLDPPDVESLVDALVAGTEPGAPLARRALESLVDAGHATSPGAHRPAPVVRVVGTGDLADEVTSALVAMGRVTGDTVAGDTVAGDAAVFRVHVLERAPDRADTPPAGLTCWLEGHLLVLAPRAVSAHDAAARRAATRRPAQRAGTDQSSDDVCAVLPPRARVLASACIAAEALRRTELGHGAGGATRADHLATVLDLLTLRVTQHPVLPVPRPPA